jgi:5'-3' exonuclease
MRWIWNYYTGSINNVCFNWFYPYSLPPLWKWLCNYIDENGIPELEDIKIGAAEINPIEQLSLVLPLESWGLVGNSKQNMFPIYAPQYFPVEFSFESVGKRYFWECEANIPIPSILEVKEIMSINQ